MFHQGRTLAPQRSITAQHGAAATDPSYLFRHSLMCLCFFLFLYCFSVVVSCDFMGCVFSYAAHTPHDGV
jgi:hypothetical protein